VSQIVDHIQFSRLVDLVEGRCSPDELTEVWPHLRACPRCAAEVAWLERVIGLMRIDKIEHAPAPAVAAAKRMFRLPLQPQARPVARPQLIAMLQFDSARTPIALGMRAGAAAERQLLYSVPGYLLDLRLVPEGSLWVISGQLLGADSGQQVELHGPAVTLRTTLNDLSEFVLPPTLAGSYTLTLQLDELDILVAGLEVGV
jgi:hypothetical protein